MKIEEYDALIFRNHKENKDELMASLEEEYELVLAYFNLADMIGHLSFGLKAKMKVIYKELDSLASLVRKKCENLLIVSDHGMRPIGRYGDHTNYGFWSFSEEVELKEPKITKLRSFVEDILKE